MKLTEHAIVVEQLFQQAQTLLQAGEPKSAESVCARALDQYPDDPNLLCLSETASTFSSSSASV